MFSRNTPTIRGTSMYDTYSIRANRNTPQAQRNDNDIMSAFFASTAVVTYIRTCVPRGLALYRPSTSSLNIHTHAGARADYTHKSDTPQTHPLSSNKNRPNRDRRHIYNAYLERPLHGVTDERSPRPAEQNPPPFRPADFHEGIPGAAVLHTCGGALFRGRTHTHTL